MPARVLVWSVLISGVVGLGGYWLARDRGVGDGGLVEESGGGVLTEEPVASGAAGSNTKPTVRERAESNLRTAVQNTSIFTEAVPTLEVRIFLDQQPLTEGMVFFSHARKSNPRNLMPSMRGIVLNGTNEAKIPMPLLLQDDGTVTISAQYTRQKPGTSTEIWTFQATIPGPKKGQRWLGPNIILKTDKKQVQCSGHVMDAGGRPVAGSTVGLMFPSSSQPDPVVVTQFLGRSFGELSVVTDKDGFFEIRHGRESKARFLHLDVSAPGHVSEKQIPFRPGTTDLTIVLERAGSLSGSLVLPTYADPRVLRVGLFAEEDWEKKEAGADLVVRGTPSGIPSHTVFDLKPLRPGRYVLTVGFPTPDQPVIVISGIEIHAGQVCKDARFQDLDLRGRLKAIRVQVVAEHKSGPLAATVSVQVSGAAQGSSTKTVKVDSFGWARLTIPRKGVDLTVQAPGYKTLLRQGVRDHLTIELKKEDVLPRVEVQIKGRLPKKTPSNLWLELVPSGAGGKRIQAKSFSLEGCYYFYEVPPGSYRVRVYLKRRRSQKGKEDRSPRMFVDQDPVYQVLNREGKQLFDVSVDHGRLLRFLKDCKMRSKSATLGR